MPYIFNMLNIRICLMTKGGGTVDKNILDVKIEEKDGEYIIRLKGEKAASIVEGIRCMCGCCAPAGDEKKAAASCC